MKDESSPTHFKGKDAMGHVAEVQAAGIIASAELHGVEQSGQANAGADAVRETAVVLAMLTLSLEHFHVHSFPLFWTIAIFSLGWGLWKTGRSAWLGWSRLERLHRILSQERWEIEHHRQQEREELRVLYSAKGFEGKLLDDVLDVLMADNERLLKVMIEEEMGLSLQSQEHPLKQGIGAGLGVLLVAILVLVSLWFFPQWSVYPAASIAIAFSAAFTAHLGQNNLVAAALWNLGIAVVACSALYFLLEFVKPLIVTVATFS